MDQYYYVVRQCYLPPVMRTKVLSVVMFAMSSGSGFSDSDDSDDSVVLCRILSKQRIYRSGLQNYPRQGPILI